MILMEPGFQLDAGKGRTTQARWMPGEPVPMQVFYPSEASRDQRRQALRITTYRCPKCGLLDSYATDPVNPA